MNKSLLTTITILSELSKSNTQLIVNFNVLLTVNFFKKFMTFKFHPIQFCVKLNLFEPILAKV